MSDNEENLENYIKTQEYDETKSKENVGNDINSPNDVNDFYNIEILPKEVKKLPFNKLDPEIQDYIIRIDEGQILDSDEYKELRKVLKKYRPYIEKYKPDETVDNYKKIEENITTEQELLDFLDNDEDKKIHMRLDLGKGEKDLYFDIAPLDDSRAIKFSEAHVDIYANITPQERKVYEKSKRNETMTREEMNILEDINEKLIHLQTAEKSEIINEFLAWQLTPPDFNGDIEMRKKFWATNFPFYPKIELFSRVAKILGLSEENNEKLFPDG